MKHVFVLILIVNSFGLILKDNFISGSERNIFTHDHNVQKRYFTSFCYSFSEDTDQYKMSLRHCIFQKQRDYSILYFRSSNSNIYDWKINNIVLEQTFGLHENDIRKHCTSMRFLNRFLYVNKICIEPLLKIEKEILALAASDSTIQSFIDNIKIAYSFQQRNISGSHYLSLHSYGLALDLIPKSYDKKNVYWRWSRALKIDWQHLAMNEKWHPPLSVIRVFEKNGFCWGGRWREFDNIHFEANALLVSAALGENIENIAASSYRNDL